jgi:hypothetical protein
MKRIIPSFTTTFLALAGVAQADTRCAVPMTDWQPRGAVVRLADEQGWIVRRIKIDDGCYEVIGTDVNGRKLKVKVNPATLAVMDYGKEDDDHHKEDDDHQKNGD